MADAPDILFRAPISQGARMLGALLWTYASHGENEPFVWPSTQTLAERTAQTRQGVSRQLAQLMDRGLISRARRNVNGKWLDGWTLHRATSVDTGATGVDIDVNERCGVGATGVDIDVNERCSESNGRFPECQRALHRIPIESPMNPQEAPVGGGGITIEAVREGLADGAERMSRELYDAGKLTWGVLVEMRGQREAAYDRNRRREYEDAVSDGQKPSRILLAVESLDPWWLGRASRDEYRTGAPPSLPATWASVLRSPEDHIARAPKVPKVRAAFDESAPMFDLPTTPKMREWAERMAQQAEAIDG